MSHVDNLIFLQKGRQPKYKNNLHKVEKMKKMR